MSRAPLSPAVRYPLIVVVFALAAWVFDYLALSLLRDDILRLAMGMAKAQADALVIVTSVLCGGGIAGLVATAPLVGRELRDRDRGVQLLLYFTVVVIVPAILLDGSTLFLILSFLFGLTLLGIYLYVERRVRGERLPIPTERMEDRACPACGSFQVDLVPTMVATTGPLELVCYKCDHRWRESHQQEQ